MHITWHGNYTIKIQSGDTTLVIDPHASFRGKGDLVALSNPANPNMSHISGVQGEPTLLTTAGEYSVKDMTLHALGWHDDGGNEHTIQRWDIEKLVLLHLGDLDRELEPRELQELERTAIDILFLPADGEKLPLKLAATIATTIEPRILIPINFTDLKSFAKEMGLEAIKPEPKFIAKAGKLPVDEMQTIVLKA